MKEKDVPRSPDGSKASWWRYHWLEPWGIIIADGRCVDEVGFWVEAGGIPGEKAAV